MNTEDHFASTASAQRRNRFSRGHHAMPDAAAVSPDPVGAAAPLGLAVGTVVEVREEDWLVRSVSEPRKGEYLIEVTGASDLVRGHEARFLTSLDQPRVLRPEDTRLVTDTSKEFQRSRLFLEAVMRRTPLPQSEKGLALTDGFLIDRMDYQLRPAEKALANPLRPRLLIGDVVGLGKTLEIGVLLGELVRRGRGERILVVTPAPVLEQFQHEMWTRFALPLVRLDSAGIARIERRVPAGRNPFTYYKRVIVSMDTIKNPKRYKPWLENVHWDAVVIDESHNLIGESSERRALANLLAEHTDALILASATPHNGKVRSFAGLVRLLDPMAIKDVNDPKPDELSHLYIRRTKTSREVARVLATKTEVKDGKTVEVVKWAARGDSRPVPLNATDLEEQVFAELASFWLRRPGEAGSGGAESRSDENRLFPYVLLKSFLSSHRALFATTRTRLAKLGHKLPQGHQNITDPASADPASSTPEVASLLRLARLAHEIEQAVGNEGQYGAAKLAGLVGELREIGVRPGSGARAVVFSERRETLDWLGAILPPLLGWKTEESGRNAVKVLHSLVPDTEQQEYVDEFARAGSDVRLLLTGDGASEGVNLHRQCHHLIHWDLPWSLIRVEQRNGRIDRYGQQHPPEFRAMILVSGVEGALDDRDVAQRVLDREKAVHKTLGTVEAVSREHDADKEERRLMESLLAGRRPEDAVRDLEVGAVLDVAEVPVEQALMAEYDDGPIGMGFLDLLDAEGDVEPDGEPAEDPSAAPALVEELRLFSSRREYVLTALEELEDLEPFRLKTVVDGNDLSFDTPEDLADRLFVLPDSYRRDQGIDRRLNLTFDAADAADSLRRAREDSHSNSLWPDSHYVGELHPVLEWITDKVLVQIGRQSAPVVQVDAGKVPDPVFLTQGLWSNAEGRPTVVAWLAVDRLTQDRPRIRPLTRELLAELGVGPGMDDHFAPGDRDALKELLPAAVAATRRELYELRKISDELVDAPLREYERKIEHWQQTLPGLGALTRSERDETADQLRRCTERLKTAGRPMVRVLAVLEPSA
ncbi:SNF2-related protein [Kitasatospora sp. NPDC085464]|uniref:SNF2-related protein n=1 Tax=Kitasatospora sp. NPDC085464 TaxID=3364063 RepID=UPI0037C858CB